ncbi:MAG: arsenic metallochaperone ArsD family protein [Chloroflexi bacterium]|nr:arsenic metallochaperone ArsD family protein [Chloroflexota bacterium]
MTPSRLVELYEMPSCTDRRAPGVPNPLLRDVNNMIKELEAEGVTVKRYSMSDNVTAFMGNPKVANLFFQQRMKVLPITIVDGEIVKVESYPTKDELMQALGKQG